MPLDPDRCPPDTDEIAEAYVMATLHGEDAAAFEQHLLICSGCRAAVEKAEEHARAAKAASRLRSET